MLEANILKRFLLALVKAKILLFSIFIFLTIAGVIYNIDVRNGDCSPIIGGQGNVFNCGNEANRDEITFAVDKSKTERVPNNTLPGHQGEAPATTGIFAEDDAAILAPKRASHFTIVSSRDQRSRAFRNFLETVDQDVNSLIGQKVALDSSFKIFSYNIVGPLRDEICIDVEICQSRTNFIFENSILKDGSLAQNILCPDSNVSCFELVEEILPSGSSFCLHDVLPYEPGHDDLRFATMSKGEKC